MSKRGKFDRQVRGRDASANSSAGAVGVSTRSGNKSKQEKEIANNVSEDSNRKLRDKVESKANNRSATPSRSKAAKDKKKADSDDKSTDDEKAVDILSESTKMDGKKQVAMLETSADVLKMESFVVADTEGHENSKSKARKKQESNKKATLSGSKAAKDKKKTNIDGDESSTDDKLAECESIEKELSGKKHAVISDNPVNIVKSQSLVGKETDGCVSFNPQYMTDKGFLACAKPLPAKIPKLPPLSHILKVSKQNALDFKRRSMDKIELEKPQVLSSEKEKEIEEIKQVVDESLYPLQDYKNTDENKLNSSLEDSKGKQELHSENENEIFEAFPVDEIVPTLQLPLDINIPKLNLDVKAPKAQVSSNSKRRRLTEPNFKVDESTPIPQCSKETEEQKLDIDLKSSKIRHELPSSDETKEIELKTGGNECKPTLQCLNDLEQKLSGDLKSPKTQDSSENESLKSTLETKVTSSCSKDMDERKLNLDRQALKMQQELSSENKIKVVELETDREESTPTLLHYKDVKETNVNLDLKASNIQELSSENVKQAAGTKLEIDESSSLTKDSKLIDINKTRAIQNLDLNVSNCEQDISSEISNKINDTEIKNRETVINLNTDVDLRFEFDNPGNKKVLIDEKDQYTIDKKQKINFVIGDGDVQLSFIDNNVSIFSQKGEIDCSLRNNQMVFSLTDSNKQSDSSSIEPSKNKLSQCEDTKVVKDLGIKNPIATTIQSSLDQSEKIYHKSGSEIIEISTLTIESTLVTNSVAQRHLQNITDIFLEKVKAACDEYEINFLECLSQIKGNKHTE